MAEVSIIVPVFGVEDYIERCARSLFEQSLDDIEYIIVNDCTQDRSMDLFFKVVSEYPGKNIKVINLPENKGLPTARKTGLAKATGKYVVHCDSDDWLDKDYCKVLYENAESTGADIVVCGYRKHDGIRECEKENYNDALLEDPNDALGAAIALKSSPFVWNKLVRRTFFEDNPLIFPSDFLAEDWVMAVQYAYYATKIVYVPNELYNYFYNPVSKSRFYSTEQCFRHCRSEIANVTLICCWLKDIGLFRRYKEEICKRKSVTRSYLFYVIDKPEGRAFWRNTFPETNIPIIFNKYVTKSYKHLHLLLLTGLYTSLKSLIGRR